MKITLLLLFPTPAASFVVLPCSGPYHFALRSANDDEIKRLTTEFENLQLDERVKQRVSPLMSWGVASLDHVPYLLL